MSGHLYIVAAPSGAGKTTLVKLLLESDPDICLSISATTRPPRPGEQNGREYHFVNVPDFLTRIDQGEFLEWAAVHGNYYGTSKRWIAAQMENGRDVLLEIDPEHYEIAVKQAESLVASRKATWEMRKQNARRRADMDNLVISRENRDDASNIADSALADYQQAQAQLEAAELNLKRTEVRAAVDGYVTNLNVHRGDYARIGEAKMAVVDMNSFWVYGFFEETKLPHIRVGDTAELQMMSGEVLKGHVESISRGIYDRDNPESRELIADVNPTFNWVRLALSSLFVQWIVLLSAALFCRLRPWLARLSPVLAGCLCCALVVALTLGCTAVADYYELGGPLPRNGEVNLYLRDRKSVV